MTTCKQQQHPVDEGISLISAFYSPFGVAVKLESQLINGQVLASETYTRTGRPMNVLC